LRQWNGPDPASAVPATAVKPPSPVNAAVVLLSSLLAAGCARSPQSSTDPAALADRSDSRALLDFYVAQHAGVSPAAVSPALKAQLGQELTRLQAAAARGENVPNIAPRLQLARLELLARAGAEAAGVYVQPSDAELQQAYQAYLRTLPASEYHVAHILVATERLAADVVARLDDGANFADLAAQRSADDSKSRGGDLGWIHPGHLPEQFFEALKELKPGEYTKVPVHTPYGWHVIRLSETRAASPPPFDQVKAQLATNLQQERYQRYLDDAVTARKNAGVGH
jgi:peptidyl-prolyl cis-trans isomerase C